jgi:hypothetical protein
LTFIPDEDAEKALHWLVQNAKAIGEARREAVLAEHMVKRVKAIETKRSNETSVAAREADAMTSEAMLAAITADAEAAGKLETLRGLRDAAGAKLDVWRTLRASERAMQK